MYYIDSPTASTSSPNSYDLTTRTPNDPQQKYAAEYTERLGTTPH